MLWKTCRTITLLFGLVILLLVHPTVNAFESVDEQIDHYLEVLHDGSQPSKIEMLQRLQWSGLSDARLYDAIEKQLLDQIEGPDLDPGNYPILPYNIRALGFSGNEKYRAILEQLNAEADDRKFRSHASKALRQLDQYIEWNRLIEDSLYEVDGSSVEVGTYMKMLDVDNVYTQRLAARAIYHEKRIDPDLLALAAEKLERLNSRSILDKQEDDTGAWLCKALGESGDPEYIALLATIAGSTQHRKIKKYASQIWPVRASSLPSISTTDSSSNPVSGSDITGTYVSEMTGSIFDRNRRITISQSGNIVTGTWGNNPGNILTGTRDGDIIVYNLIEHGDPMKKMVNGESWTMVAGLRVIGADPMENMEANGILLNCNDRLNPQH